MLTHCVGTNMSITKILPKQKDHSNKLLIMMSDIILLGGVLEIYATNNKNMIKLLKISIKLSESTVETQFFILSWE